MGVSAVVLLWIGVGAALGALAVKAAGWCVRRYRAAARTVDALLDLSEGDAPDPATVPRDGERGGHLHAGSTVR